MVVTTTSTARTRAFLARPDALQLASRGPMTPDHVIRTKRVPMLGRDVEAYARDYRAYFDRHRARSAQPLVMLDPAPRVVIDAELGLLAVGRTARNAAIASDIALHTLDAIERANALEEWQALPEGDLFDVEYWELEQAKLARAGAPALFAGEVALVTGGASGIGRATVEALRGAGRGGDCPRPQPRDHGVDNHRPARYRVRRNQRSRDRACARARRRPLRRTRHARPERRCVPTLEPRRVALARSVAPRDGRERRRQSLGTPRQR